MRKKSLLILLTVLALSAIMLISAATIYTLNFTTMTANVAPTGTVTVSVNAQNYTNGQSLTFDWVAVTTGQNTRSIIIYNNVNAPVTPSIATTNLPSGWILTLSDTSAISAYGTVTRSLVLTVPSNPTAGDYSWSATLNVSS